MPNTILLLSIKPEYAEKIFNGTKTVELRRVRTRLERGDIVLVYVSAPQKSLVGFFEVENVKIFKKSSKQNNFKVFWQEIEPKAGLTRKEFLNYYQGASIGICIFIRNPRKFPKTVHLEQLRKELNVTPPQSYRYLTDGEVSNFESMVEYKILKSKSDQPKQIDLPI